MSWVTTAEEPAPSPTEDGRPSEVNAPGGLRAGCSVGLVAGAVLGTALLAVVWFDEYQFRTLMGDDLILLDISNRPDGFASQIIPSLFQTGAEKYRPVWQVVASIITDLFGGDFRKYKLFNLLLLTSLASLVGCCAFLLSGRRFLVALLASGATVICRFNLYNTLQIFGAMESLGLIFVVLMLISGFLAVQDRSRYAVALCTVFYGMAIFTHERYLPLFVFATLVGIFSPARHRLRALSAPSVVLAANYAIKTWLLDVEFMTGGGGQVIAFSYSEVLAFAKRAILNTLGFNTGPDYLSGRNANLLGGSAVAIALFYALPVLAVMCWGLYSHTRLHGLVGAVRPLLFAGSVYGPLVLGASITFRQEFRWLLGPQIAVILGVSWAFGSIRVSRRGRQALLALVALGTTSVSLYYRPHFTNTYFFNGQRVTDSIYERVLLQYGPVLESTTIFLITGGDPTLENWFLADGYYFTAYGQGKALDVRLVASPDLIASAADVRERVIVADYRYGSEVVVVQLDGPAP